VVEVKKSDLLVEDLGQDVDANVHALDVGLGLRLVGLLDEASDGIGLTLNGAGELDVLLGELLVTGLVQHDLGKDLVGERAGHDERAVASGAAKVDKTALGEEDDVTAGLHGEAVDLGLDGDLLGGVGLEPGNVDLNVEVTNVADNGVLTHGLEVLANEDVTAASGGDEDLALRGGVLHGDDLEAGHGGLESVDGVDLSDENTSTHGVKGVSAALSDITETGDDGDLASNHDIGGTLDTVDEGLAAAVKVVELGLGDGVVDVDGGNEETVVLALVLEHAVEVVHTGGGLLGETVAALELLRELVVDKGGKISTIVEDQVEGLSGGERLELLLEAPVVLLLGLALPGEDGDTGGGDGSGGVVLGGEDVAGRPGDLGTEGLEGLDEDSGLDGCGGVMSAFVLDGGSFRAANDRRTHVKAASNTGAGKRLLSTELLAGGHKTRHLLLGELNLATTEGREVDVGDLVLLGGLGRHDCGVFGVVFGRGIKVRGGRRKKNNVK
jgi:hypothetical protein